MNWHWNVSDRVMVFFAWTDFWVGAYWDRDDEKLYVLPFPMIGVRIDLT